MAISNLPFLGLPVIRIVVLSLVWTDSACFGAYTPFAAFCTYDDCQFGIGQEFPATDGCNSCRCESIENVICTTETCSVEARDEGFCETNGCFVGGRWRCPGEVFFTKDCCNSCRCGHADLECTNDPCPWLEYFLEAHDRQP